MRPDTSAGLLRRELERTYAYVDQLVGLLDQAVAAEQGRNRRAPNVRRCAACTRVYVRGCDLTSYRYCSEKCRTYFNRERGRNAVSDVDRNPLSQVRYGVSADLAGEQKSTPAPVGAGRGRGHRGG